MLGRAQLGRPECFVRRAVGTPSMCPRHNWTKIVPLKNMTHKEVIEFITKHIIYRSASLKH
jgi:3'-phosphoadenosine 5'-phosphosulfate sulfotransferase (PAPS reductase)/FAD synthetase